MSLSDKIRDLELFTSEGIPIMIHKLLNENDVREAVKELKKRLTEDNDGLCPDHLCRGAEEVHTVIDEIFGEKLI